MSIAFKSKTQYMCFATAMKISWIHCMFGATPSPTTSDLRSSAYAWPPPCCWQPHQNSSHHCNNYEQRKTKEISNGRWCTSEGWGWLGVRSRVAMWRAGRTARPEAGRKIESLSRLEAGLDTMWQVWGISPRSGQARVGCPNLWPFWGCPCPPPWQVQRSSGVFSETLRCLTCNRMDLESLS